MRTLKPDRSHLWGKRCYTGEFVIFKFCGRWRGGIPNKFIELKHSHSDMTIRSFENAQQRFTNVSMRRLLQWGEEFGR